MMPGGGLPAEAFAAAGGAAALLKNDGGGSDAGDNLRCFSAGAAFVEESPVLSLVASLAVVLRLRTGGGAFGSFGSRFLGARLAGFASMI